MGGLSLSAITPDALSWEQALRLFLLRCRSQSLAQPTLDLYGVRLGAFIRWAEVSGLRPAEVQATHLRAYLGACRARGNQPATLEAVWRNLRTFWGFLARDGLVLADPMFKVERPRLEKRLARSLSEAELQRLLETIDTSNSVGLRDHTLVLLLADTGLRISEALALRSRDIDWAGRILVVLGKRRERRVPFGERAHRALDGWCRRRGGLGPDDWLWIGRLGDPLRRTHFEHRFKRYARAAGIAAERIGPHSLRHFAALAFLRAGGSPLALQRLLGHEDLSMTRRYCALTDDDVVKAHRQASPLDRLGPLPGERKRVRLR